MGDHPMQKEMLLLKMKSAESEASHMQCYVLSQLYFSLYFRIFRRYKKNAYMLHIPGF